LSNVVCCKERLALRNELVLLDANRGDPDVEGDHNAGLLEITLCARQDGHCVCHQRIKAISSTWYQLQGVVKFGHAAADLQGGAFLFIER